MVRSLAITLVALLGVVLLCGCGSSSNQTAKQARIQTALRKLEHEFIAGNEEVYAAPPHGVGEAEWNAAINADKRLQRLAHSESIEKAPTVGRATMIELAAPAAVVRAGGQRLTEFEAGKRAVAQSGCLACHKIGVNGNNGPGPDLTEVADRLPKQAIQRTLIRPTAPMPSFKNLPPAKFHAIVAFLAQLK